MHELLMIRKLSLGDKCPRKLLCIQNKSLGVGLIAPNTVIGILETRWWVGNKRLKGDFSKIIEVHKENSFIDSRLRKKERREESYVKNWKEGWTEEVESAFSSREIEMLNEDQNVEIHKKKSLDVACKGTCRGYKRNQRRRVQNQCIKKA